MDVRLADTQREFWTMMNRRSIFKAIGAVMLSPLACLRRGEAATVHGDPDMASGPGCTVCRIIFADGSELEYEIDGLDTTGPYDRLGNTVKWKRVAVPVYDVSDIPTDQPHNFTLGHPDCEYCHGKGTVLDSIGKILPDCLDFKLCPACQRHLKRIGAKCWYVEFPRVVTTYVSSNKSMTFRYGDEV